MRLVPETLARELARSLPPFVLIAGDEPLLVGEAADAVRARAKQDGYASREVVFVERGYDWNQILAETRSMSLFAERRILELRMPSPKPGPDGSRALAEIVRGEPPQDLLILLITDRIEWSDQSAAWVKAFEEHGVFCDVEQLSPERLPEWLVARMRRLKLEPDDDAVQLLAERCEGNLVAAHQEIERLALLAGPGRIDLATVESSVANSARYNVFQLGEAALAGDAGRVARVLDGLAAEGEEPVLALWCLTEEVRAVMQWAPQLPRGAPKRLFRGGRRRQTLIGEAARRLSKPRLRELLLDAAHADAVMKGARAGEPWSELLRLGVGLAGTALPARPALR
jgi:DNA polymerase-3 subunit delta